MLLILKEGVDNDWPGVMNECLTSRLHNSVEQSAELVINELSEVFKVVPPVSFHDLQNYNAQCAAVVEPLKRCAVEVAAGALVG